MVAEERTEVLERTEVQFELVARVTRQVLGLVPGGIGGLLKPSHAEATFHTESSQV